MLISGGDVIYVLIIFLFSIFISYNLISYYFILKKSKCIKNNCICNNSLVLDIIYNLKLEKIKAFIISKQQKLFDIGKPYGINISTYIFIKYFISILLFVILLYNSRNVVISAVMFFIIFFLQDVLIYFYKRNESNKLISEISNVVQNIILSLSANMSLYNSLLSSINVIKYNRFKLEFIDFINKYKMYNYSILESVNGFEKKFDTYEFDMFLSILVECEKEGNYIELLENFNKTLDIRYFKFLNMKYAKNLSITLIAIILALANSFLIVGYPIISEISTSLLDMFK